MKIERILLRNYRGVAEHEVRLGDGVTIVEGGNEAGKSSLAEAIGLLIDFPDGSQDSRVDAVRPTHTGRPPEAEIDICAGPYRFTYRKRWSTKRDAETTLRVTTPASEVLHGRDAHERVKELLAKHADLDLWAALRVLQSTTQRAERAGHRTALEQPELSGKHALMRALDLAAGRDGGALGDPGADSLHEEAQAEFARYFTGQKRNPSRKYAKAIEAQKDAAAEVARRRETLDRVGEDIDEHRRTGLKLAKLKGEAATGETAHAALEEEHRAVQEVATRITALENARTMARMTADAMQKTSDAREDLRAQVRDAQTDADKLAATAEELETRLSVSGGPTEQARDAAAAAQDAEAAADLDAARAVRDRDRLRELGELDEVRDRRDRAAQAAAAIEHCTAGLATIRVSAKALKGLVEAREKLTKAEAALAAASALVEVSALDAMRPLALSVDGRPEAAAAGSAFTSRLTDATTLTVDNLFRIRITPGNGEDDRRAEVEKLRRDFGKRCAAVGAADLDDARAQDERRRTLEKERDVASARAETALGGKSLDAVTQRITELSARVEQYRAVRTGPALPETLAAADAAVSATAEVLKQRQSETGQHQATVDTLRHAMEMTETELRVARQRVEDATAAAERQDAKLAADREKQSDAALKNEREHAVQAAEDADLEWRTAVKSFDAAQLAVVAARMENSRSLKERRAQEIRQCDLKLVKLNTRLEADHAASERLNEATTLFKDADEELESTRRRAEAAKLLYDTLNAKRNAAKLAYVQPFHEKLEQYARIVFGEAVELVVDDDLAVTDRVLKGARVPYEQLSGGAREQLALCSRLACAALVDPADGVPVVIDDALGFTDPERLERIGAVFSAAGGTSQILILTRVPDRYRAVGKANVVQLRRNAAFAPPE